MISRLHKAPPRIKETLFPFPKYSVYSFCLPAKKSLTYRGVHSNSSVWTCGAPRNAPLSTHKRINGTSHERRRVEKSHLRRVHKHLVYFREVPTKKKKKREPAWSVAFSLKRCWAINSRRWVKVGPGAAGVSRRSEVPRAQRVST